MINSVTVTVMALMISTIIIHIIIASINRVKIKMMIFLITLGLKMNRLANGFYLILLMMIIYMGT